MRATMLMTVLGGGSPNPTQRIQQYAADLLAHLTLKDASGTRAANIAPARATGNIIKDGSFDVATAGEAVVSGQWDKSLAGGAITRTTAAGEFHGVAGAKLVSVGESTDLIQQNIVVTPGRTYTFSCWGQGDGTNSPWVRIAKQDMSAWVLSPRTMGLTAAAWAQYSVEITIPAETTLLIMMLYNPAASTVFVDDCTLVSNVTDATLLDGTYLNATLNGQAASFSGNGCVNIARPAYANHLMSADANQGAYIIHGSTTLAALADGVSRWMFKLKSGDVGSNYLDCFKVGVNKVGWQMETDGDEAIYRDTDFASTLAFSLGSTWSVANGAKFFLSGVQIGAAVPIVGGWTDPFDFSNMALGSESSTGASGGWIGSLHDFAVFTREFTAAEMLHVGKP
jgi:hypothetical protein